MSNSEMRTWAEQRITGGQHLYDQKHETLSRHKAKLNA
jgi:hypothetical protein